MGEEIILALSIWKKMNDKEEKKIEKPSESDFHALDAAKMKKMLAQANVEKAQAQMETVNLYYEHTIFQLSIKYGLSEKDSVNEKGEIFRDSRKEEVK